jgi:hypothetical protein
MTQTDNKSYQKQAYENLDELATLSPHSKSILAALTGSDNVVIRLEAQEILYGVRPVEEILSATGGFMTAAISGDFLLAFQRADKKNKAALRTILDKETWPPLKDKLDKDVPELYG